MVINAVASLAEAWIEISGMGSVGKQEFVASLAEAWIEISISVLPQSKSMMVASLAEAWIEMLSV